MHFVERRTPSSLGHLEADLEHVRGPCRPACCLGHLGQRRRYSTGMTFLNFGSYVRQSARIVFAFAELV